MQRRTASALTVLGIVVLMVVIHASIERSANAQSRGSVQVPNLEVDPFWPKPLPNHWLLGSVTGVAVDAQDNVWIVHQGAATLNARTEMGAAATPPTAEACCVPAPAILKFSPGGDLLASFGGPGEGYAWPRLPHGVAVDSRNNVWIGGVGAGAVQGPAGPPPEGEQPAARGAAAVVAGIRGALAARGRGAAAAPRDAQVLKFSGDGKFLLQIGAPGRSAGNESRDSLNLPANVEFDAAANEIYVADGGVSRTGTAAPVYGNHRVAVFNADNGQYKRHFGAYGARPDDTNPGPYDPAAPPAKQFRGVNCVRIARDGLVYVCDRENNRIQVFQKDGKFVKEAVVSKTTLGDGAVWDIDFSSDAQQRFMYVADGHDKKILVLVRDTLEAVSSFGTGGRQPGQFFAVGSVAVDSRGNVYTGETYEGKRVQKWVYRGLRNVSR
jgi:sugar lactone lactonase YvrE